MSLCDDNLKSQSGCEQSSSTGEKSFKRAGQNDPVKE